MTTIDNRGSLSPAEAAELDRLEHAGLADGPPETILPHLDFPPVDEDPHRIVVGLSRNDVLPVIGAAASGIGVALLLSAGLGVVPGGWSFITAYVWFLGAYAALIFMQDRGPAVRDRFWTVLMWSTGVAVLGTLAIVIVFTLVSGQDVWHQMFDPASGQNPIQRLHFLITDMSGVGPLAELSTGGILHAIVATLIQIGIALAITIPLGITTALFIAEVGGRFARLVRTIVEAMTALPSVVAGLFIYAAIIVGITHEFNGFAASLAITVLMLPIMIRSSDVVLRLVPGNLREAGLALGAGQWSVVLRVVLPTVRSGLVTAIILATAHGIGETAPVLLTAGVTSNLNVNPFSGPMTSLPLAALEFVRSSQNTMKARGFATAAVLLILVLVLFLIARKLGGQEPGKMTPQQRARLAAQSAVTSGRMNRNRDARPSAPATLSGAFDPPASAPEPPLENHHD